MYYLIEYSENYSNTSGSLMQYYRDEPNDDIKDCKCLKFKVKIIKKARD